MSSKYIEHYNGTVIDTETGDIFDHSNPSDPRYVAYQSWMHSGGIPDLVLADPPKRIWDTDTDMARVSEDLIDTLISKGIISLNDLPQGAQDKFAERKNIRGS